MFNAAQHAMQLLALDEKGMKILGIKNCMQKRNLWQKRGKQSRKTFAMMMKNVLCGLTPICAKHRVATSPEKRIKPGVNLFEIEGKMHPN